MVSQRNLSLDDLVTFPFGTSQARGVIVEDRGSIGINGRRLLSVRIFNDPFEDRIIEMPEEELSIVEAIDRAIPPDHIIEYLSRGGLVDILMHNTGGNPQKVWLTVNSLGRVVHTFHGDRGIVGGADIPFFALQGNRIFIAKRDQILEFLKSFGLTEQQAEIVAQNVGTAP